jgi:hypothetical protein
MIAFPRPPRGSKLQKYRRKQKKSRKKRSKSRIFNIQIPTWVKITDYRTMDNERKQCAVDGCKCCQNEWMVEEVNEFYEAIHNQDPEEICDEAMGLIRTYQQFRGSPGVVELWEKVRKDVAKVFSNRDLFESSFQKWHEKKLKKNQALGVSAQQLAAVADLQWIE